MHAPACIFCYTGIMEKIILAGTYTSGQSRGIYRFTDNNGQLDGCGLFYEIRNPKYLAKEKDRIAAAADFEDGSGIALFDRNGRLLDRAVYEQETSCYITLKDDTVFTANFHAGTFARARIVHDTITDIQTVRIREKAGCHQVLLYKDCILVPCLNLDRVMVYGQDLEKKTEIVFEEGTGPRHGVFAPDGKYLYLVSELSNELFVIETETWKILHALPVLMNGERYGAGGAAIRLSEDGKTVYVSTREKEILSVIRMEDGVPSLVQNTDCGGRHPRDFILCGGHLLAANRFTNDVTAFALNEDGTVGEITGRIEVPEAVSLIEL